MITGTVPPSLLAALLSQEPHAVAGTYTVRFESLERASVTAEFRPAPAELFMNTSATHLADGFASFVRDLRALSNSHTSHTGVESVRVCAESAWYAWALDGTAPSSMEVPTDELWVE